VSPHRTYFARTERARLVFFDPGRHIQSGVFRKRVVAMAGVMAVKAGTMFLFEGRSG